MYKCEICGKEYANLKDRANCEWCCSKRLEIEDAQHKQEILKKEKKVRADEVNKAYNEYQKLYKDYQKLCNKYYVDYGDTPYYSAPNARLSCFF